MIKEFIQGIAKTHNATLTFSISNDNFWKRQEEIATITDFANIYDKVNCQYDITDQLDKWGLDYKMRSGFNPDKIILEWRE